jgi:hypothetical protein
MHTHCVTTNTKLSIVSKDLLVQKMLINILRKKDAYIKVRLLNTGNITTTYTPKRETCRKFDHISISRHTEVTLLNVYIARNDQEEERERERKRERKKER